MDFTCFNNNETLIDLCLFGGMCVWGKECQCPSGYETDVTFFVTTRNCALPNMALEALFGCFSVLWVVVFYIYFKYIPKHKSGIKTIKAVTTIQHLSLFTYMAGTTYQHAGREILVIFGTVYLLCFLFVVCEISIKLLNLGNTLQSTTQVRRAFVSSIPFTFSLTTILAIVACVHMNDIYADITIIVWYQTMYVIIDIYILRLICFTNKLIKLIQRTEFRHSKDNLLISKFQRMRWLFVIFGVISTVTSLTVSCLRLTLGSVPFSWLICLVPISTFGTMTPLVVAYIYHKRDNNRVVTINEPC